VLLTIRERVTKMKSGGKKLDEVLATQLSFRDEGCHSEGRRTARRISLLGLIG
jgi:hypothetical protein